MGEVDLGLTAGRMDLLEEDLAVGAVNGAPVPDPALQRAKLAFTELARQGRAVGIESFTGWPWAEIDTPADLEAARRLFPATPDAGG